MLDHLDALRSPGGPRLPSPDFTRRLLARVHSELHALASPPALRHAVPATDDANYAVLDDALAALAGTGPEYDPFGSGFCLTNHVSMIAESLCALARPDAVMPAVEHLGKYLSPMPEGRAPITAAAWRDALGRLDRVGDWVPFFVTELDDADWVAVVDRWVPRLAPGSYAVHGLLRTAHAVRALGQHDTPLRRHELADALGYWAALYETLPEAPATSPRLRPSEAFPLLDQPDVEERVSWMLFTQPIAAATALPSFATATDLVDLDGDPSEFLTDLAESVAAALVTNASAGTTARGIVHALTAGTATRLMLPYLSDESTTISLRYGWQVAAAFYAGHVVRPPQADPGAPAGSIDDLIDDAVACPDEHGAKIAEACLREYSITPNPVFLAAARACIDDLAVTGLRLA
jgi:hypothetical protein